MYKMLSDYCRTFDDRLNLPLINRELDKDLYLYVYEAIKSLEVCEHIEILGYEYTEKENEIQQGSYIRTRQKNGKKENDEPVKIMYIAENRLGELKIHYRLSIETKQDDGSYKLDSKEYYKNILIPLKDEDGYYTIKGKRYILMYQLVDATTYTTSNSIVLKSIMPIPLKRKAKNIISVDKIRYNVPVYSTQIFRNEFNILALFFAKMGLEQTLTYFSVDRVIDFVEEGDPSDEKYIYFKISQNVAIKIHRQVFDSNAELRSMVGMIIDVCSNRITEKELFDRYYWLERLGKHQNVPQPAFRRAKAENLLVSVDRMIDMTTRRVLNIAPDHKDSMYSALRWMFMNYDELKNKQIMDITNKRLRDNEYIASLMTGTLSNKLYRAMGKIKKTLSKNLSTLEDIFSFKGDILINELYNSGLFKYDDVVNDMDFWNKLKFTIKGPNAQGGKTGKTIASKQRGTDPSFIGRIGMNVVGNSDPGATGVLTPFIKTDGLAISDKSEPEFKQFELLQSIEEALANEEIYLENFGIETFDDYQDTMRKIYETTAGCTLDTRKEIQ